MKEMGIGRPRGREHTRQLALLLALSCFGYLLYHTLAGGTLLAANGCDSYSLQAQNWLQGSLSIRDGEAYPWLELAIFEGRYYLSFPPLPTLFVLPFVWLGGGPAPANLLVALYALATLAAVYGCFCRLGHAPEVCAFWACAFTFATNLLEISRSGGVWYQAQALNLALCALAAERFAAKRRSHACSSSPWRWGAALFRGVSGAGAAAVLAAGQGQAGAGGLFLEKRRPRSGRRGAGRGRADTPLILSASAIRWSSGPQLSAGVQPPQ